MDVSPLTYERPTQMNTRHHIYVIIAVGCVTTAWCGSGTLKYGP